MSLQVESDEEWDSTRPTWSIGELEQGITRLSSIETFLAELASFDELEQLAAASAAGQPTVYAVRLIESELAEVGRDSAGITFDGVVPVERIVGRVEISPFRVVTHRVFGSPDFDGDAYLSAMQRWRSRLAR